MAKLETPVLYSVIESFFYNCSVASSMSSEDEDFAYSSSFLEEIVESIKKDDVRGPLVAVLNELNVQRGGVRRSAYREILYLVMAALGKSLIDVGKCCSSSCVICSNPRLEVAVFLPFFRSKGCSVRLPVEFRPFVFSTLLRWCQSAPF